MVVGKDPKLGVLRHLRTYAKQWKKYQEAQESGGVRQALTKALDDIDKLHVADIYNSAIIPFHLQTFSLHISIHQMKLFMISYIALREK